MDERPIKYHNTYSHHEAGHAVAFWHYGIEIEYVTVKPSYPGHSGETKPVSHEIANLAQIEAEMQCAAAGEIAARMLYMFSPELTDVGLIDVFARGARTVTENPDLPVRDGLEFAKLGLARDAEISRTTPGAATGPETWLPIFRAVERLIEDELWPAVKAVAYELTIVGELHNEEVAALAARALPSHRTKKLT